MSQKMKKKKSEEGNGLDADFNGLRKIICLHTPVYEMKVGKVSFIRKSEFIQCLKRKQNT